MIDHLSIDLLILINSTIPSIKLRNLVSGLVFKNGHMEKFGVLVPLLQPPYP